MRIGQQADITIWDEGTYPATVVDVVETVSAEIYGSKPRLRHVFRVWGGGAHGEGEFTDVWYFTGATFSRHPSATLRPLVGILRPDLNLDDPQLDVEIGHPDGTGASEDDALIGSRCRVILGVNEERGRNQIEKVLPLESRRAPLRATPERRPVAAGAGTNGTHREREDEEAGF